MVSTDERILSCGHSPSPHGEHTTGTGRWDNGPEMCWECCYKRELEEMQKQSRYTAYLSLPPNVFGYATAGEVTTWTGHKLGTVTEAVKRPHNLAGKMWYFQVTAVDGSKWYGRGVGSGMICYLRRRKVGK